MNTPWAGDGYGKKLPIIRSILSCVTSYNLIIGRNSTTEDS